MKKKFFALALALCSQFYAVSCLAQTGTAVYAYTNNTVECLGTDLDGTQTVRVSGIGKNRAQSRQQCKKNAVWYVIFKGIRGGLGSCNTKPLLMEPNAQEKYEDYFNAFFADDGEWQNYMNMDNNKKYSQKKAKSKTIANYTYTVNVLRPKLKQKLIADGILKTEE